MSGRRYPAHPVSDLFPMLPDDELATLAADIKARGQLQPIVLDSDGRILDGRNRLAACRIADVEPVFTTYEGDEPEGYALMVNIARREMTKGQKAMVVASAIDSNSYKVTIAKAAAATGVSHTRIAQALTVRKHATEEVDRVLTGIQALNDAYDIARKAKKAKEKEADDLADLREDAPDLADDVIEERITFDQALELLAERREDAERAERVAAVDALRVADNDPHPSFTRRVEAEEITWAEADTLAQQWRTEYDEAIERDVYRVQSVNDGWASAFDLLTNPGRPRTKAILEALTDIDRKRVEEMRDQIINRIDNIKEGQ